MTVGSYEIDHTLHAPPQLFGVGRYEQKSWTGADRPTAQRGPAKRVTIPTPVRQKDGSLKFIQVRRPGDRPPKRAIDVPHDYDMNYVHRLEAQVFGSVNQEWYSSNSMLSRGAWSTKDLLGPNDQIKLVNKLRQKLKGSDFNASVMLAEFGETMRMIGDTAIRLAKCLWHLKKGDLVGTSRALFEGASRQPLKRHDWRHMKPGHATAKRASEWWLEVQYGWRPLLDDVQGAAEAVAHAASVPFRQRYSAQVQARETSVSSIDAVGNYGASRTTRFYHGRRVIAYMSEDESVLAKLGLLDPLSVVWELLPFSFVADWFIPIGQWIEARGVASRLKGTFVTTDYYYSESGPLQALYGVTSGSEDDDLWKNVRVRRRVSGSLDVPLPAFKPLKKALGWEHCANGIALLVSGSNPYRR